MQAIRVAVLGHCHVTLAFLGPTPAESCDVDNKLVFPPRRHILRTPNPHIKILISLPRLLQLKSTPFGARMTISARWTLLPHIRRSTTGMESHTSATGYTTRGIRIHGASTLTSKNAAQKNAMPTHISPRQRGKKITTGINSSSHHDHDNSGKLAMNCKTIVPIKNPSAALRIYQQFQKMWIMGTFQVPV